MLLKLETLIKAYVLRRIRKKHTEDLPQPKLLASAVIYGLPRHHLQSKTVFYHSLPTAKKEAEHPEVLYSS